MSATSGTVKRAIVSYAQQSLGDTRRKLDLAVRRVADGKPLVAPAGAKLTVASVAKEAGVDRTTVHRFHRPVVDEIRRLNAQARRSRRSVSAAPSEDTEVRLKEYRALVIQAQAEVAALARINYRLQAEVDDLKERLRIRDERVANLQRQVNPRPKTESGAPGTADR